LDSEGSAARRLDGSGVEASHVLLVQPRGFRFNPETVESNVFQEPVSPEVEQALGELAVAQHAALRDLLVENGITVTLTRSLESTPDGPFCNNWFSTHPPHGNAAATLVLYPMLAVNRRPERRRDLVGLLRPAYPRLVDLSQGEAGGRFLESTGSLVLDHRARVAYAARSPRTDRALAEEWARELGYDLLAFTALDPGGTPYYHTNVLMFIGHGVAGVCLEAIDSPAERATVQDRLVGSGNVLLHLTRTQVGEYCGNCLALRSGEEVPLWIMSSRAWRGFAPREISLLERHGRILHTDLSAFERLGGGSARCLIGELF
jgi:hypothetical protein